MSTSCTVILRIPLSMATMWSSVLCPPSGGVEGLSGDGMEEIPVATFGMEGKRLGVGS